MDQPPRPWEPDGVPPRNVLMLTYHFPPSAASGSFRLLGFARHLPSHGWRTTVVAPPSLPWEPVDQGLADRVPAGTTVYHVPYMKWRVTRLLAAGWGWLIPAAKACARAVREQRPDAVLTSGPPHEIHLLGLWLKKRYGLPWAADFRDPWFARGLKARGRDFASRRVDVQEAAVMRGADAVIANAPGACRLLQDAYPQHRSKFLTLPNGYDREEFETLDGPPSPEGRPLRLVHTGAIYFQRDPRPVLDALKSLTESGRTDLAIDFYGPPPECGLDLADAVRQRGLAERVVIAGQVPYARCLRAMASADVLMLMDSPGRKVGVPAKLYEYIGAGRPVLALGERGGDLERVLMQGGVPFRIAPPDDAPAIAEALAGLAEGVRTGERGEQGGDPHRFSRETLAGRLAGVLDRCVAGAKEFDLGPSRDGVGSLSTAAVSEGV
ncbi:MAG: glycosyltransferase family 4 protein [Isosphaeraceae bacterium]